MPDSAYSYLYNPKTRKQPYEHRIVWEAFIGRIPDGHVIHHINEDPQDNRVTNLLCMPSGLHTRLHHNNYKTIKGQLCRVCKECGKFKPVGSFYQKSSKKGWRTRCKPCYNIFDYAAKQRRLKEVV